ncbi:MAG: hypothetical protein LBN95_13490, partial [Prevotellaceae bacterium]|nr:hypothetical protein [Prevotellaceae bacterium]
MNQKRIFSKFAMAIAVFALISGGVSAQKKETRHYLGGWLYGGYSAMFHSFDNTSVLGGAGGGFGLGYQLRRNQFIFNTGVEFEFLNSATKVTGIDGTFPIKDTQGKDVSFNAHFPSYRDHQKVTYLNLPILAGMQFNGDIPFYFLAGVKVGTPIKNTFSSNGTIRTDGWYEQYIDTFINMPNHYYKEQDFNGVKGVSIFSKINVMASVEFGVDINKYIFKEQEAAKKAKQKAKK